MATSGIAPAFGHTRSNTWESFSGRLPQSPTTQEQTEAENGLEHVLSGPKADEHGDLVLTPEDEQEVTQLARRLTRRGTVTVESEDAKSLRRTLSIRNPFVPHPNRPDLDPTSEEFNIETWLKNILAITSRDPERYPHRTAGFSIKNLNVFGYSSGTSFQENVANVWLKMFGAVGGKPHRIDILREVDALVKSGELLVVLGRPGAGCTTALKTIAGETYGLNIAEGSEIDYQGIPYKTMHKNFRGEVIYQAETDIHFPMLTVGETLEFAAAMRTPRNRLEGVSREQHSKQMAALVMAVYGLSHTVNTKVGNDFVRGVSGGERKRVSIAEATLSGSPIQCWDNSTRGLDSANALEFVKTLRLGTRMTGSTCCVAIYQASQSIYDLFDKVLVLYEGRQIYFGPANDGKRYFEEMGFECAPRMTTADFLTSVTSPAERVARDGMEEKVPRTPDEFAALWRESAERKRLLEDIDAYRKEFPVGGQQLAQFQKSRQAQQADHVRAKSPFTISVPMQIKLCIKRGFQRTKGDAGFTVGNVIGNCIMALIVGSVFFRLPEDTSSFFGRSSILFFAILMNAFSSALEILTLYAQRPIVEKHNKYALYHPFSEAVAGVVVELPPKIAIAVLFNIIIYFMANLKQTPAAFFIFLLFSFFTTLTMSFIFRTIGAASKTMAQALAPAAVFILALVIYTGFAIPIGSMVGALRWLNYLNPIAYSFEALMANEYHARTFQCVNFVPSGPGYENVTGSQRTCTAVGALPGGLAVDGDRYIGLAFKYYYSHVWRNFGIILAFMVFFAVTYLVATEYISAQPSKGEILVFPRKELKKRRGEYGASDDEESSKSAAASNRNSVVGDADRVASISRLQKQTDIFMWKGVNFTIKIKGEDRQILNDVSGWVKPGTLTALMGVSGAGKTTLLDVLASRVTIGVITGDMLVSGRQRDTSFQRKTGYVQQQDVHLSTTTVREALRFSALMRQPAHISTAEKYEYVEEVIKILEMENYAEAVVGVPGEGLNVEQRKRLTIGCELAAKPELLLFFDEPTSGLDSQTSWSICQLMRKLADNGQAVLGTIHQPSAILLQEFDRLLFLAKGGKTVYYGDLGENCQTLIDYFERNGAPKCPPDANPAEWMLEAIGAAPGSKTDKDWFEVWNASPEKVEALNTIDRMTAELKEKRSSKAVNEEATKAQLHEYAAPFWTQFYYVCKRVFEQYWRTPSYIYSKIGLVIATALFVGFSFWDSPRTLQGLQNQMFSVFLLLTIFGNLTQQIMPNFVVQRALYETRERPSKTYSWKVFILAQIAVELPWQTLMAVLTFFCWYYPIGFQHHGTSATAGLMFAFIWIFYMFASTFAIMMISAIETADGAANIANLMFSLCLIFCGVLAQPGKFPHFWIWMYRVSPFTYLVGGLLSTGLANTSINCSPIEMTLVQPPRGTTCGDYLTPYMSFAGGQLSNPNATSDCQFCSVADTNTFLAALNIHYDERWRNFGLMFVYTIFNAAAAVFLYWLARVPKRSRKSKSEA